MSALPTYDGMHSYGTDAECSFLDQIAKGPNAVRLLSNYIAASERRTVWTGIDKSSVLLYAELLLGNAGAAAKTERRVGRSK